MLHAMPEDYSTPTRQAPASETARTTPGTHPKTEPDARVLAEYMRLVEEARMRT